MPAKARWRAFAGKPAVIGYLLFHALQSGVYELGWAFNRRFWRQGYAFEALDGLIAYAFEKLGAHKVFAETIDTVRSVGLMRKLGMRREGVQRAQTQDSNGAWTDLYLYGMTCGDYWAGRPQIGDKEKTGLKKRFDAGQAQTPGRRDCRCSGRFWR